MLDASASADVLGLSAMGWFGALGPTLAWLIKTSATTLSMLGTAVLVAGLSRIHRRLRARNAVLFEGGANGSG